MDSPNVVVFAGFKAKEDKAEQLLGELISLVEPTRLEEGCIEYEVHQDSAEPGSFMFYEVWRSQEDLVRPAPGPALVRLLGLVPELCSEPPMIKVTVKLARFPGKLRGSCSLQLLTLFPVGCPIIGLSLCLTAALQHSAVLIAVLFG